VLQPALERQQPILNPTLANHALALLAQLFRYGTISYRGAFVGLTSLAGVQPAASTPNSGSGYEGRADILIMLQADSVT